MRGGGFDGHGGWGGGGMPGMGRLRSSLDAGDGQDVLGKIYDPKLYRRFPRYMGWVKKPLAIGAFGALVVSGAQLAMPLLVRHAIDTNVKAGDIAGLTMTALLYLGTMGLMFAGQYLETLYLAYAAQGVLYKMRMQMFDHLHRQAMAFFDSNKVGKLMSRVQNDVEQLQRLFTDDIVRLGSDIITLVVIVIVMFTMNARLALITFSVVPVLVLILTVWQRYARIVFIRTRQAIAVVNDNLQESISGVRVTQSLAREGVNVGEFDAVNRANLEANVEAARLQAFMMPTVQILTEGAYVLVLVFGGMQVLNGTMGPGTLLAFLLYIQRFFQPVQELTMLYTEIQRSMASAGRIFELLDVQPAIEDAPKASELPQIKGAIQFRDVHFSYETGKEVLHNISLSVNPGETVAICGRTGAGKSSLTSLVARFYEVTQGAVLVDGYDVSSVTQDSLRRQIGIVPQDPFLFSGTIGDNIRYGRLDATQEEVIEAAKAAGVHELITHMSLGYDTPVGERGGNLSAGQRQLVCLARAILADPPVMILDEATSSVDTNTERIMQQSLRRLSEGRTCLVIAHRLSTITGADRIIVMEHGNIIESGTHRELMANRGTYYDMYETLSAFEPEAEPAS